MGPPKLGRQLAAARALAGMDRSQLATKAGLARVTVKRIEQLDQVAAYSTTLDRIAAALLQAGVEFTDEGGAPGVRLRRRA